MPTKIDLHAFHINLYLHEFFEPILFFDPQSQRKIWPSLKIKPINFFAILQNHITLRPKVEKTQKLVHAKSTPSAKLIAKNPST